MKFTPRELLKAMKYCGWNEIKKPWEIIPKLTLLQFGDRYIVKVNNNNWYWKKKNLKYREYQYLNRNGNKYFWGNYDKKTFYFNSIFDALDLLKKNGNGWIIKI